GKDGQNVTVSGEVAKLAQAQKLGRFMTAGADSKVGAEVIFQRADVDLEHGKLVGMTFGPDHNPSFLPAATLRKAMSEGLGGFQRRGTKGEENYYVFERGVLPAPMEW